MTHLDPDTEKHSERIFWVIQTIFGFIIGRSFYQQAALFIPPFYSDLLTISIAIISVYLCVIWSWIDFSYTLIVAPYQFRIKALEKLRFLSDLVIMGLYSYIVIDLEKINAFIDDYHPEYFITFALIFFAYLISGLLRIREYGKKASRWGIIISFLFVYIIIYLSYSYTYNHCNLLPKIINRMYFTFTLISTVIYRLLRAHAAKRKYSLAVDMDGVLANQIMPLLPIINEKFNTNLKYEDITEWALPIGNTNIASIIIEQQQQKNFIIEMPVIADAKTMLDKLFRKYRINIVTARDPETDSWTIDWLHKNKIHYDNYENSKEGKKQNAFNKSDILIDDYERNIVEFLKNSEGKAILFSQPWNLEHNLLNEYIESGRLGIAQNWKNIPSILKVWRKQDH